MNKDQVNGRIKAIEGAVKELTGKLLGNSTLKAKGKVEKTLGKLQASYGDLIASLNKPT
jgi:uncharacterized protein YjbJ (UPF0337 family)